MITRAFRTLGYYQGSSPYNPARPYSNLLRGISRKKEELDKIRTGRTDLVDELAFFEMPRIPVTIIKNHDR